MDLNSNDLTPAPWPVLASHCPPDLLVGFAALAPNAAPSIGPASVALDFPPKPVAQPAPMLTDEQMRAAFEAWLNPGQHAGNVSAWVEPGRYEKDAHQLAWLAWRAATKRAATLRQPPVPFASVGDLMHPGAATMVGAKVTDGLYTWAQVLKAQAA